MPLQILVIHAGRRSAGTGASPDPLFFATQQIGHLPTFASLAAVVLIVFHMPLSASTRMCAFIPKNQLFPGSVAEANGHRRQQRARGAVADLKIIPNLGMIKPNMGSPPVTPTESAIGDALFPRVRQRVLALFYSSPDRSFFTNEVVALAQSGTGAVHRELASLAHAGLLVVSTQGNQKHYRANPTAPVFEELRGLVLKTSGLVDVLRSALVRLSSAIDAAFVFGSVAKRQESAQSDVDLLVVSDALTYADLYSALEEAGARLGRPVNPTLYTRAELAKRIAQKNAFANRVLSQEKLWVIGNQETLDGITA